MQRWLGRSHDSFHFGPSSRTPAPAAFYRARRAADRIVREDARTRAIIEAINNELPSKFNVIIDKSRDEQVLLIRSSSDVDEGTYYLFDLNARKLERLGAAYPELDTAALGRMQSIRYAASDGSEIPGYLTVPPGLRAEKLPLIVLPHGGPVSRDSWEFSFLRAFLVSRGYAVLQMNFRG